MNVRLTRRQALERLGNLALGGALASALDRPFGAPSLPLRPNIILMLADDLKYADLGCYGQAQILTPNIDALARGGMRFTQFYAGACVCAPSRCALMTGLHTGHARVRQNAVATMRPEDVTVATLLKSLGYATAVIGKWHLGGFNSGGEPWLHGFDEFFGTTSHNLNDYYPTMVQRNTRPIVVKANQDGIRRDYFPDMCHREALAFIRRCAPGPFFLFLTHIIPHGDANAYAATGNGMVVPTYEPYADRPWPDPEKGFAAMVTRLDSYVGDIVRLLRALGIAERTVIFFTSDSGAGFRYGHDPAFFGSTGPLRGHKGMITEGGIRVPVIAYWPAVIPAGVVSAQQWAAWDLLPTMLSIAGETVTVKTDGLSMLPVLLGGPVIRRDYLYWESHEEFTVGPAQAVRVGNWKGVRHGLDRAIELYDLSADVGETTDVSVQHPEVVEHIAGIMASARTSVPLHVNTPALQRVVDCVQPDQGLPNETRFLWQCRAKDPDADAPLYVRLSIHKDGAPWQTVDMTRSDRVSFRGRLYYCRSTLPAGNFHYHFEAADKDGTSRLPLSGAVVGPVVPSHPYLMWTGERGYEADGVHPHGGVPYQTEFRFRVQYRAHDGDLPQRPADSVP